MTLSDEDRRAARPWTWASPPVHVGLRPSGARPPASSTDCAADRPALCR